MTNELIEKIKYLRVLNDDSKEFYPELFNIFLHDRKLKVDYANFIKLYEQYKNYEITDPIWRNYFTELEQKCPSWHEIVMSDFSTVDELNEAIEYLYSSFIQVEFTIQDLVDFYKECKQYFDEDDMNPDFPDEPSGDDADPSDDEY